LIFEERTFTTKKEGFKDLSQISIFALLFTGEIALLFSGVNKNVRECRGN
jgi:hypothetical protein